MRKRRRIKDAVMKGRRSQWCREEVKRDKGKEWRGCLGYVERKKRLHGDKVVEGVIKSVMKGCRI